MTIPSPQSQYIPDRNSSNSFSPPTSPIISESSTLNSHFVQALHDYLPSSVTPDEAVSCLFFKKGSIIEVFNRDDSGWWDGQCGNVRGWFPSNYVGKIGELKRQDTDFEDNHELETWHQKINQQFYNSSSTVSLLEENLTKVLSPIENQVETTTTTTTTLNDDNWKTEAIKPLSSNIANEIDSSIEQVSKQVIDLVDACHDSAQSNIQLHIFEVVASVRLVLTEANVVNKESPLLKLYPELARQRKIVLSALSRLVLKGKSLQQANCTNKNDDQISYLADQLLNELDLFEKLLIKIPQQPSSSSPIKENNDALDSTQLSSLFQVDTPRSSISSIGHSSIISNNSTSFRQSTIKTRHSNNSFSSIVTKLTALSDKESVLQSILDQQASIDELMTSLVMTLERYLVIRHRATEILEITRKAVEAVRMFLAVVEHVYSIISDIEQSKRQSIIPEDPSLVSLVLTKESVYSAITNLVTAVRALTGPHQPPDSDHNHILKDDFDHLCLCCEKVVKAINECATYVRACLDTEESDICFQQHLMIEETNKSELSIENSHKFDSLNILRRKASSLQAIQQYRRDQSEKEIVLEENEELYNEQTIEDLAIETVPTKDIDHENEISQSYSTQRNIPRTSSSNLTSNDFYHTPRSSTPSLSTSTNSLTIKTNTLTASAVDTITPETNPAKPTKLRPRAASVNNTHLLQLPPKNNIMNAVKPSVSAAFPLPPCMDASTEITKILSTDQSQKTRRSRGLSVTSIKSTISKSKLERVTTPSSSVENISEPLRIQKVPSWMSINTNVNRSENNSVTSLETTPTLSSSHPLTKKEPEFEFLKQIAFTEEEMMFNAEGEVTGATVEALVRKLTLHEKSPDLIFTRAFFYNFRLFTNPEEFVRLLTNRFTLQPPTEPEPLTDEQLALWTNRVLIPIRLRVYNVIKTWLETYFNYEQDTAVEKALIDFASNEMSKAMPGPAKRMIELIKRTFSSKGLSCTGSKHVYSENRIVTQKSSLSTLQSSTNGGFGGNNSGSIFSNLILFDDHHHFDSSIDRYPPSILGKALRNTLRKALSHNNLGIVHVNDFDPAELARQLTLMENNLFCRIRPNEMIGQEFKKKVGTSQAVHVKAMIQRSTQITSWVSDTILKETDTKKRAQVLKYWIKVGDACLQLNNYNTLMAIRSALDSTSIARLKKTWDHLSVKYRAIWEPIYRATDSQRNFAEYRQRLKTTIAPCLPFLGVYLTDMTFIDDGNADYRMSPGGKQLINFDKYIKFTRILNEIDQFQFPYKLFEVEEIQRYLKKTLESVEQDDQVFYAKSLKHEPKEEEVVT
ncbi:ras guanine nucleotide exchange factor domain-containing protein [Cokeromyces recurvatus]|uniref:ras guanine nucleotide exchange factor domain-containing protein n=1 Tax=Cokeromyces recurvatus TaxID=90255 RepID=UPI002220D150|nr:ras guanine nucleotide exchange factor domain-containing protein [Cokeromyces recurvatus]KAI7905098.1 ras guanine nucleotide exchange factor domain-containing protein [Cokeromyces recurvatus]